MPVYKGTEFIERIHKGTEQLRRVYKGNELVYGLYDINYHNRENDYTPSNGEITEYAWGLTRDIAPEPGNTDFDDYFEEYRSHWYGWYDDINYQEERPQYGNQYIIIPQDCKDLNLYAKWKQKKFSYEGSYTITGGYSTSSGGQVLADEAKKYIGKTGSQESPIGGTWSGGTEWCARFVSICLQLIGHDVGMKWTAPEFFNGISTGSLKGTNYISKSVSDYNGGAYSNWVIKESDLQPGDILCDYNINNQGGWITRGSTVHSTHVVIVVSVENGRAKVVGGNEGNGGDHLTRKVNGPHDINFRYWCCARLDFGDTATSSSISNMVEVNEDCEDQNSPNIPDMYINGDGLIPEDSGPVGDKPPLPSRGTYWTDLPESWYSRSGGWYNRGSGYGGECTWGAQGRSAQLRNNYHAGAPYGSTDSGPRGFNNAYRWLWDHGGNWSSTIDWRKVQVGDIIVYGCNRTCEADDGSGTIRMEYSDQNCHVAVVEEVLGDGRFKASSWNWTVGTPLYHCYTGVYEETCLPGSGRADYSRVATVSGYLINHIDKAIGSSNTYSFDSSFEKVTSERVFDYNTETWGEWHEVDRSPDDWNYEWGEE